MVCLSDLEDCFKCFNDLIDFHASNILTSDSRSDCGDADVSDVDDFISFLQNHRYLHPHNLIVCHLNINSLSNKFQSINPLLYDKTVDLLFLSETKLDESYPSNMFSV